MGIKICLDAGHAGKYNRSPAVPEYYESDMNWKLHLLLKAELERYGIEVKLTRSSQAVEMGTITRGNASRGCDLFLSIHANAVGGGTNDNVDYPLAIVQLDGKGKELGTKLATAVKQVLQTKQAVDVWTKKNDSGQEAYGVLRGAAAVGTMGIILEHSFYTNTRIVKMLMDESTLRKLAEAEAAVIAEWFGVSKKEESTGTATAVQYCVQVGAYSDKANAEAMLEKVKAAGFADAFIVAAEVTAAAPAQKPEVVKPAEKPEVVKPTKKSVDEIAKEVINGDWGNGAERKQRLTAAGYDYATIQKRVNEMLKG
jgi:N-acetylmuramoyl-L-alanine amidase